VRYVISAPSSRTCSASFVVAPRAGLALTKTCPARTSACCLKIDTRGKDLFGSLHGSSVRLTSSKSAAAPTLKPPQARKILTIFSGGQSTSSFDVSTRVGLWVSSGIVGPLSGLFSPRELSLVCRVIERGFLVVASGWRVLCASEPKAPAYINRT
jgi:hypothetical protein